MISLICGILKKNDTNELIYKTKLMLSNCGAGEDS